MNAPWSHGCPPVSAASPSRRRWPSTPRPRRSRPPAGPSSGSAPASPTSRPPTTSSRRAVAACADPQPPLHACRRACPSCAQAIAAKTLRDSGLEVAASQVLVTNGGKQAVYQAFATLLDPGDEVLLPAPYWTTYPEAIALAGGVPVAVPTDETTGYLATVEQLEAARTPRTKVLLFSHRPTRPARSTRPSRSRRSGAGRSSTASGWSPTRSTSTSSYGDAQHVLDAGRGARAGRHVHRRQRRREDVRDDRLAGRLDDRADRRRQGRGEPSVAPDQQRRATSRSARRSPRSPAT